MEVKGTTQGVQINSPASAMMDNSIVNTGTKELSDLNANSSTHVNAPRISEKEIQDAFIKMNRFLQQNKTHAEYRVHDKLKNVIMIKIVDDNTGDVVTEIPPKRIMDMVAKMCEKIGVIVDNKA